jgi:hypothetical protein
MSISSSCCVTLAALSPFLSVLFPDVGLVIRTAPEAPVSGRLGQSRRVPARCWQARDPQKSELRPTSVGDWDYRRGCRVAG